MAESEELKNLLMKVKEENFKIFKKKMPRQHIKKQSITLLTKICLVKAMVFPVVMYGCKSWTMKKAEHQRIAAFEVPY